MKEKINWVQFGKKVWSNGISTALKEEVVPITTNTWDNIAVDAADKLISILLPSVAKSEEISE